MQNLVPCNSLTRNKFKFIFTFNITKIYFAAHHFLQMSSIEFLEVCRDFRLGDMLRLGMVKSRMRDGSGLSCTEFLYQIFQSYDWYRLSCDYNCHFQVRENICEDFSSNNNYILLTNLRIYLDRDEPCKWMDYILENKHMFDTFSSKKVQETCTLCCK